MKSAWTDHIREVIGFSDREHEIQVQHDVSVGDNEFYCVTQRGTHADLPRLRTQAVGWLKEAFEKAGFSEADVRGGSVPDWTPRASFPFRKDK